MHFPQYRRCLANQFFLAAPSTMARSSTDENELTEFAREGEEACTYAGIVRSVYFCVLCPVAFPSAGLALPFQGDRIFRLTFLEGFEHHGVHLSLFGRHGVDARTRCSVEVSMKDEAVQMGVLPWVMVLEM